MRPNCCIIQNTCFSFALPIINRTFENQFFVFVLKMHTVSPFDHGTISASNRICTINLNIFVNYHQSFFSNWVGGSGKTSEGWEADTFPWWHSAGSEAKVSSAKFPFCKLFPIYRKHHRFKSNRAFGLPFLGSKSKPWLLAWLRVWEHCTSKRKSKCFYFKIHHLQLSSKFVSPICRLHFSRHILVIDLNLYFLHAPSLPIVHSGQRRAHP